MVPDSYLGKYDSLNPLPPRSRRKKDCHSFSADSVLGRSTKAFDIKGIVTMVCRYVLRNCACISASTDFPRACELGLVLLVPVATNMSQLQPKVRGSVVCAAAGSAA